MILYNENESYKLYHGNMLDMLSVIPPQSIDSVVTDPPYELNFMGKGWDNSGIAFQPNTWKKCYEVLKPGGYLLAFGGSRTFHRIACAIEDAGFEIRDTIMWLYGSGFPKSMNIGLAIDKKNGVDNRTGNIVKGMGNNNTTAMKNCLSESQEFAPEYEERVAQNEWAGWGTCLKPAFEPIIIARKPFDGSLVDNVLTFGVGGLNIDECRVPLEDNFEVKTTNRKSRQDNNVFDDTNSGMKNETNHIASADPKGRFPANVILTYDETDYAEVCGGFPSSDRQNGTITKEYPDTVDKQIYGKRACIPPFESYKDSDSAARYFYCAKASKKDRNDGCAKNNHPTVKPEDLTRYLVRLVTPNGGTVLDPFNGSGSTGKAVMLENVERGKGYKYIGIEMTDDYLPISKARIEYAMGYVPEKCHESVTKTTEKCHESATMVSLW